MKGISRYSMNMLQYPNLAEEMDPESIKYRFESCVEHHFIPFVQSRGRGATDSEMWVGFLHGIP